MQRSPAFGKHPSVLNLTIYSCQILSQDEVHAQFSNLDMDPI